MRSKGFINGLQFGLGVICLLLGILIYVTARPAGTSLLPESLSLRPGAPSDLIGLGGPLPTFLHVLALSLLTAAVVRPGRRAAPGIGLGWAALNVLFELGQQRTVAAWLAGPAGAESVAGYFLHGTFDGWDLMASLLGAAVAWPVILKTERGSGWNAAGARRLLAAPVLLAGVIGILGSGSVFDDEPEKEEKLPPVNARDDSGATRPGVPVTIRVLDNDDQDDDFIDSFTQARDAQGNQQPQSVDTGFGYPEDLVYTPPEGFTGTVTFTYTIDGLGTEYDSGSTDTATVTVTVAEEAPENLPPTAAFSVTPATPEVDQTVMLNAGGSTDTDGSIVSYQWDFQNDGTFDATGVTTETTYSTAGTFTARLRVTDDDGATDEATRDITVTEGGGNGALAGTYRGSFEPGFGGFDLTIRSDGTVSLVGAHELIGELSGGGSISVDGQLVDVSATGSGGATLTMEGTFYPANGAVMGNGTWATGGNSGTWSAE